MFRIVLALTAVALPTAGPTAAAQQLACTARSDVVGHLSKEYSEQPVALGLANNGGVIEILSSQAGTSWTIILTMPNGLSCMIAAGKSWQPLPRVAKIGPST